jgi:hypothetical protein
MAETKDKAEKATQKPAVDPRFHTVKEDVTEKLKDGRQILIARKGTVRPIARAVELGLVKTNTAGPTETKESNPTETK